MQRIKRSLLTIFIIFQLAGYAQVEPLDGIYKTQSQEQRFESLINLHKQLNAMNNAIPGYRLTIYFEAGNYSKAKAIEVKNAFDIAYPGYIAYISFDEPYYRVKVGDFRTKIEAIGFLKKILKTYPNAFEVKDMISFNNY